MEKKEKNITNLAKLGEEKEQLCFDFYHLSSYELTELINKKTQSSYNSDYSTSYNYENYKNKNIKSLMNAKAKDSDINKLNIKTNFNDSSNPIKSISMVSVDSKVASNSNSNIMSIDNITEINSCHSFSSFSLEEEFLKQNIWTEVLESQWRLDKNNLFLNKNTNIYQDLALFMKQNKLRKDDSWYLPIIYAIHEELIHKKSSKNNVINSNNITKEDFDNHFFDDVKNYVKRKKMVQLFPLWFANQHQQDFLAFKQIKNVLVSSQELLNHYNQSFLNQDYTKTHPVECIVGLSGKKHNEIKRNCFSLNTFIPAGSFYDNKYIHINTYYFEKEIIQGKSYANYNFSRIFLHELGHAIYSDILHEKNHVLKKSAQERFLKEHIKNLKSAYVNYRTYNFKSFYDKSAMAYYVKHKIEQQINPKTKKHLFLLDRGFEESFAESFSIISYIMLHEEYKNIKNTIKVLFPLLKLISESINWSVFGFNQIQIIRKQKIVNKFLNQIKK